MIQLKHVYKTFQSDRHTLRDISLQINSGEFVFIQGASGAGKTTLFKVISGFEKMSSGQAEVLGRNLTEIEFSEVAFFRREIGFIFQNYKLIKEKTVLENVLLPLEICNIEKREAVEKAQAILDRVGLKNATKDYPEFLSGGEQQRVAIARALVHSPKLIIADEPTGNLDALLSQKIIELFKQFSNSGTTFLIATHDERIVKGPNARLIEIERGALIRDNVL